MALQVPFYIKSGLPYAKEITVTLPTGRTWWTNTSEFEVKAQIREGVDYSAPLLLDLTPFLSYVFSGANVVVINLDMNGSETRQLLESGFYDILMSDPLTTDARVIRILDGPVYRESVITAA